MQAPLENPVLQEVQAAAHPFSLQYRLPAVDRVRSLLLLCTITPSLALTWSQLCSCCILLSFSNSFHERLVSDPHTAAWFFMRLLCSTGAQLVGCRHICMPTCHIHSSAPKLAVVLCALSIPCSDHLSMCHCFRVIPCGLGLGPTLACLPVQTLAQFESCGALLHVYTKYVHASLCLMVSWACPLADWPLSMPAGSTS